MERTKVAETGETVDPSVSGQRLVLPFEIGQMLALMGQHREGLDRQLVNRFGRASNDLGEIDLSIEFEAEEFGRFCDHRAEFDQQFLDAFTRDVEFIGGDLRQLGQRVATGRAAEDFFGHRTESQRALQLFWLGPTGALDVTMTHGVGQVGGKAPPAEQRRCEVVDREAENLDLAIVGWPVEAAFCRTGGRCLAEQLGEQDRRALLDRKRSDVAQQPGEEALIGERSVDLAHEGPVGEGVDEGPSPDLGHRCCMVHRDREQSGERE